jgi:toxin CcdB
VVIAAQFDVFRNSSKAGVQDRPYVIVLQSGYFSDSRVRVCAPLVLPTAFTPIARLNPEFQIEGRTLLLSALKLAALPVSVLRKSVANLEDHSSTIQNAIDGLFRGI